MCVICSYAHVVAARESGDRLDDRVVYRAARPETAAGLPDAVGDFLSVCSVASVEQLHVLVAHVEATHEAVKPPLREYDEPHALRNTQHCVCQMLLYEYNTRKCPSKLSTRVRTV